MTGRSSGPKGDFNGTDEDVAVARITATGSSDTTFGAVSGAERTGYVTIPHAGMDNAESVKIQPDGKLSWWGSAALKDSLIARLMPDGTLDTGFGSGGIVIRSFSSGSDDFLYDVAVQGDGKIVAVGAADPPGLTRPAFLVARFLGDSGSSPAAASLSAPSSRTAISSLDQAMFAPLAPVTDLDLTQLATEWLLATPRRGRSNRGTIGSPFTMREVGPGLR